MSPIEYEIMNKARVLVSRWMGLLCSGKMTVDTLHGAYHQRQPPAPQHIIFTRRRGCYWGGGGARDQSQCSFHIVSTATHTFRHNHNNSFWQAMFLLFVQKPQGHVQLPQCNHQFPYDTAEHPKTRPDTMIIINTLHGHATRYARGPHVFRKADI